MNVSCPNCGATYRVDPGKVPAGGIRARCTRCGDVMQVGDGAGAGSTTGAAASVSTPAGAADLAPGGVAAPVRGAAGEPGTAAAGRAGEAESGQREPAGQPSAAQAQQPLPQSASPPPPAAEPKPRPAPAFGSTDPDAKARRLARALISDIVVYHPERRDRSLEAGTLRQEFREEIQKSWEEYVAQVGDAAARRTPHFREALNEILAGGRPVF